MRALGGDETASPQRHRNRSLRICECVEGGTSLHISPMTSVQQRTPTAAVASANSDGDADEACLDPAITDILTRLQSLSTLYGECEHGQQVTARELPSVRLIATLSSRCLCAETMTDGTPGAPAPSMSV